MEISHIKYLVEALINNKLSRSELDDFLNGLEDEKTLRAYSEMFEAYFLTMLEERNKNLDKRD